MKKLVLAAITLTTAASVFAQGTVIFNNRTLGTSHVYGPSGPTDYTGIHGNASNDGGGGSVVYTGHTLIGGNGLAGPYGASTTLATLLGAPGSNAAEASLLPQAGAPVSFRTGTAAGGVANSTATFNNIPPDAPVASFELVAWDNSSGLYPTWAQASSAWAAGTIAAGRSTEFSLQLIGGAVNTPPPLFPGLTSFSLSFIQVPEPATAALAGLGAAAMLIFRRRKQ